MEIEFNGAPLEVRADTVAEVLAERGYESRDGVAVALNGRVVPRREWSSRRVVPGDRLDLVGAVQGG